MLKSTAVMENRKAARMPSGHSVCLRSSVGTDVHGICTDVNSGGLGVDTDVVLRVGQRMDLVLERKTVPMLVIYRMGNHYGLSSLAAFDEWMEFLPEQ
jgi:hypothetical protein